MLKQNYLYAILSGFTVGDTPGTGTFYDFFGRLWLSDRSSISDPLHPPKEKPAKPKKGEKVPPVEKVTVYDLLAKFEIEPPQDFAPAGRLFEIFRSCFLDVSVNQGLIGLDSLAISGDGTPVYTGARERKTRTCDSFSILGSPCASSCRKFMSPNSCWILPTTPWLTMSTAVTMA